MNIIEELKRECIALRKTRNPVAPSIVFALSEIEKVGKNSGNRQTTNDEAVRVIQKIITNIDENLKHANEKKAVELNFEKHILSSFLPSMVSEDELKSFLRGRFDVETSPKKGEVMKALRDEYGSRVDMKSASTIVSELYGV